MNQWPHDPSANTNSHAAFAATADPSMSFLQPPQTINPAHFQNQPYLNGDARTASPASFHNPNYQTNPVVPSKRPREDSIGQSPRPAPGGIPGSRSQTPGQISYPAFSQANGNGSLSNAPTPFQHLQTSNNASPSPTIQQMNFNQPGGPQRVATASPNPFSPQQGNPHASPGLSDNASRVGTPHDNAQAFMSNPSFGAGFNQPQFNSGMQNGMGPMGMNPGFNMGQHGMGLSAVHRNYQMQLQAQARQMQAHNQAQARNAGQMPGMMNPGMVNPMMNQMQQQTQLNPPKPKSSDEFVKGLQNFMAARGRTVDLNPVICGRQLPVAQLYGLVVRNGGFARLTKLNQWGAFAQQLGFPPQLQQQAAQEISTFYQMNLLNYESAWQMTQKRMGQPGAPNQMQGQMSPSREVNQTRDPSQPGHQRNQSDLMAMKQAPQLQNGFLPQGSANQAQMPQHRSSLSRQFDPSQMPGASPRAAEVVKQEPEPERTTPIKKPMEDPFKPDVLPVSRLHGPINIDEMFILGQQIHDMKPIVPTVRELGVIDIHALTHAIKSGMHAETRVALDTLITLSTESQLQLNLIECDDLIETLVDCAQEQLDYLADHSAEVSDEMSLTPYEDLVRACRSEGDSLQDIPEFGSVDYDLDKAADRLICITTLIRNFSFYEANFIVLGQPEIIRLLSNVIRSLGTKEMVLRNSRNTLDFTKDVIVYLSNLSTHLNLPGKQEALCLLHFLLAFAPQPSPATSNSDKISFTMYTPSIHKYMPSAVDSLAKLLARDDPNRIFYKSIFSADALSTPPYELLTRAFGLAICPVPQSTHQSQTKALVEARKPFLLQGMLAAEILASMVPSSDHPLARSWLESEDGFAVSLLRLVMMLSADKSTSTQPPPPRHPNQHPGHRVQPEADANAYGAITTRALAVLKTLVQKGRVVDGEGKVLMPLGVMPKKDVLLGALVHKDIDPVILRALCVYKELED